MASEAATPSLRLASSAAGGPPLLTGRRGTLKGELVVHNDGEDTLRLHAAELRGVAEVRLERLEPVDIAPGSARTASVTATVPALTPPGTYAAEIEVDGVTHPVTLLVTEDIALSLSEREIVVLGGEPRTKAVSMHNAGNIPLNVSHAGPVALEVDRPRPQGGNPPPHRPPRGAGGAGGPPPAPAAPAGDGEAAGRRPPRRCAARGRHRRAAGGPGGGRRGGARPGRPDRDRPPGSARH